MSVSKPIFRVDKFNVPKASMESFKALVERTHQVLQQQPGFIRDLILEQVDGAGKFNIVTIAEWQDQAAIEQARRVITELHAAMEFNPQETMQRLGIEADFGNYQPTGQTVWEASCATD